MRIFLTVVNKMSIAALQGETIRQFVKTVDEDDYGYVNHVIGETAQTFLPLHLIMRIFREFFQFSKGFQLCYPCSYDDKLCLFG